MANAEDMTGKRFGRLKVLELVDIRPRKWRCRCDCGTVCDIQRSNLASGNTTSCGCARVRTDLVGKTFGRLTVVALSAELRPFRYGNAKRPWECRCACGRTTYVVTHELKRGKVRSCGCLRNEQAIRNLGRA